MSKLLSLNKVLDQNKILKLSKIDPNFVNLNSDSVRLKFMNRDNICLITGFEKKPNTEYLNYLLTSLTEATKARSIAAFYHNKNSGIKRDLKGNVSSDIYKLGNEQDLEFFKTQKYEISNLIFYSNPLETFFAPNHVVLHNVLCDEILRWYLNKIKKDQNSKKSKIHVIDAMAGVGSFSLCFIKKCEKISSFNQYGNYGETQIKLYTNDLNPVAVDYLKQNIKENSFQNPKNIEVKVSDKDAHDLIPEILNKNNINENDLIWIILGGKPGKTEYEFLSKFLETYKHPYNENLIVSITGKKMNRFLDDFIIENEGYVILDRPLPRIIIQENKLIAHTMTF